MKPWKFKFWAVGLAVLLSGGNAWPQPIGLQPNTGVEPTPMTRVSRVRVLKLSPDGREALLAIEYSYDGSDGATALLMPVIKKKGRPVVSGWFGCDPVTVTQGKGTVTVKVKFFNDEVGVPSQFTTDLIEILLLNSTRVAVVSGASVLKTITWGSSVAPPPKTVSSQPEIDAKAEAIAAEARARDAARRAAEAEKKALAEAEERNHQLAEQKTKDEIKAREEAAAAKAAQARADQEKLAHQKAEEELHQREMARQAAPSIDIDRGLKTRITNLDVVNRSLDRSQMTIGVEFEYLDSLQNPTLGVEVFQSAQPETRSYFDTHPADISKSRRHFVLIPVKFSPPKPESEMYDSFGTDQVLVYLQEGPQGHRNIHPAQLPLTWHSPLARRGEIKVAENAMQIDNIKQDDLFSGYVGVKYTASVQNAKVRLLLFDSSNLKSIEWFATPELTVQKGPGLQLIKFVVSRAAKIPSDILKTDMVQVDLLDANGNVLATASRSAAFTWAKPQ